MSYDRVLNAKAEEIANMLTMEQIVTLCGPREFGLRFNASHHARILQELGLLTPPTGSDTCAPRTELGQAVALLARRALPGGMKLGIV